MTSELTSQEIQAVQQFRLNIEDAIPGLCEYESEDVNLLRWIKARDFDLDKAEAMFRNSLKWREMNHVMKLRGLPMSEELLLNFPVYPTGVDKQGALVVVVPFGKWDIKTYLDRGQAEGMEEFVIQALERILCFLKIRSKGKSVHTQFAVVFDTDGFSYKQVLSTHVINFAIHCLRLFEANYPERLKAAYIINAPKIWEVFWPLMKPFLSQHTVSKIQILGGNYIKWRRSLLENIEPWALPSYYGGSNTLPLRYRNKQGFELLPRAPAFPDGKFLQAIVLAGQKFVKSMHVDAGSRILWNFKTDENDIGFEFLFHELSLVPYVKVDSHLAVQDGLYDVVESGTYTLVFDNSYSKLRWKTVYYIIEVEETEY